MIKFDKRKATANFTPIGAVLSEDEIRVINFAIHTAWGEMTEEEKVDASKALDKINRGIEMVGGDI